MRIDLYGNFWYNYSNGYMVVHYRQGVSAGKFLYNFIATSDDDFCASFEYVLEYKE